MGREYTCVGIGAPQLRLLSNSASRVAVEIGKSGPDSNISSPKTNAPCNKVISIAQESGLSGESRLFRGFSTFAVCSVVTYLLTAMIAQQFVVLRDDLFVEDK